MRAIAMTGLQKPLQLVRLPDPTPGPGEVVVSVGRCGICGSDLHMTEEPAFGKAVGDVLGHELAGEVVALGKGVQGVALGDLVAVSPLASCGHCRFCHAGEPAWCPDFALQMGGYAEYALTRPRQCVRLPRSVSVADGAIVEPLAVALHGVRRAGVAPGDTALVLGAGPIGLATAYWARRSGAKHVVIQDLVTFQKDRALAMGATAFVAGAGDPVGEAHRALPCPPDFVFECVGVSGLIDQAVRVVRNRGSIVLLGLCTVPTCFDSFAMLSKEVRLITSVFFSHAEFEAALDALDAGKAEARSLVTDTIGLEHVPKYFEALKHRTHQCKVLIAPHV